MNAFFRLPEAFKTNTYILTSMTKNTSSMQKAANSKPSIVIFSAHSDDFVIGAGGTIKKYTNKGYQVHVYIFSFGENSHPWEEEETVQKFRAKEAFKAAQILGCKCHFFDLKETKFIEQAKEKKLKDKLMQITETINPEKIFTHSSEDPHPDHQAVNEITLELYKTLNDKPQILTYSVWNPVDFKTKYPSLIVPIKYTYKTKLKALKAFPSQKFNAIYPLMFFIWFRAIREGLKIRSRFAEKFYLVEKGNLAEISSDSKANHETTASISNITSKDSETYKKNNESKKKETENNHQKQANTNNILIVSETYQPKTDGVRIFVDEFIKRVSKKDKNITLIAPKFGKKRHNISEHLLEVNYKKELFNYNPIKLNRKNIKTIKNQVKNSNLIFIQGPGPIGLLSLFYARRYKKKVVCYVHYLPWEFLEKCYHLKKSTTKLLSFFFRYCYNKIDLLVIPYKKIKEQLIKERVYTKTIVAKLGVDINRFKKAKNKQEKEKLRQKLNLPLDKKIVTYVGRLSTEKNVESLSKAIKNLNDEKTVLLLVGDGEDHVKEQFLNKPNIIITGFIDNVEEYLQASDLFVMPSLTETTSLATLEAMSTQLPVLASKVGLIPKYLKRGYNGEFIAKENSSLLAKKINKILSDPSYAKELGKNARNTIAFQFSWERSINKIYNILQDRID